MTHKRKAEHRSASRNHSAGRHTSAHALGQSSKKKSRSAKASSFPSSSPNKVVKCEPTVLGSQKITSRPEVSRNLEHMPNPDTLRSTPAFSTDKQPWAANHPATNSGTSRINQGKNGHVIDLTSIPKPPHGETPTLGQPQPSNQEPINLHRSMSRVPWRSGDPTCSPPREITFGPALWAASSQNTDSLSHVDPTEYHIIMTRLISIDSCLKKMEASLVKLQKTQKFILNDLLADAPDPSSQLQSMSNLLLKLYASITRVEARNENSSNNHQQQSSRPHSNEPKQTKK